MPDRSPADYPEDEPSAAGRSLEQQMARRLQDQAGMLSRLQFELEAHVKDVQRPLADFYKFVMDPETGLVVKVRHSERNMQQMDALVADLMRQHLQARLEALEADSKQAKDTRRWLWRDIVVVGLMLVFSSLIVAVLTAKFLGR